MVGPPRDTYAVRASRTTAHPSSNACVTASDAASVVYLTDQHRSSKTVRAILRAPSPTDGAAMWRLVRDSGTLDVNSPYCYLMLAKRFARTSVVAEEAGEPVGFVAGYRPPDTPEALFVWQIGVNASQRGKRLGTEMLRWLIERTRPHGVTHLEATVTPSNTASKRLFHGVARAYGARCEETPWLAAGDFPDAGHEPEHLLRIGPLG